MNKISDLIELTKPRILLLVLTTTAMGYFLGGKGNIQLTLLIHTLIGTALASAGSGALNHCLEREADAQMNRTKNRPIPSGNVTATTAALMGVFLVLSGTFYLHYFVNLKTSFLVLLTAFLYVLVYTPLKRISWFNTFVGAIPGALPPVIGWVAATNELSLGAWILFLILFAWQHPHFYALAWIYKEDYAKAGFRMLPVVDKGKKTFQHIVLYGLLLIVVSILPTVFHMTGHIYLLGTLLLSVTLFLISLKFVKSHSLSDARLLFKASIFYFPLQFILMILDFRF